jgi:apolipoprotein N-acyltransferase
MDVVTPYNRLGDAFAWVCVAVTVLFVIARRGVRLATSSAAQRTVQAGTVR